MLLVRRSLTYVAICFQGLAVLASSTAHAANEKSVVVQFVAQRGEDAPESGEIKCEIGRTCTLINEQKPDVAIKFKVTREQNTLVGELDVDCETECPFFNLRPYLRFNDKGRFEIRSERSFGEILLVLKPSKRIGEIVLRYRPSDN